ncbi:hypothetical protein HN873_034647 [Arachis hypogaea]
MALLCSLIPLLCALIIKFSTFLFVHSQLELDTLNYHRSNVHHGKIKPLDPKLCRGCRLTQFADRWFLLSPSQCFHFQLIRSNINNIDSKLPINILKNVMQLATKGCKVVVNYIRKILLEHTKATGRNQIRKMHSKKFAPEIESA